MIRKPRVNEINEIKRLIEPFVKEGLLLPKSLYSLYTSVRDYCIITNNEDPLLIKGCCALQISWETLGEIRTLAVRKEYQRQGYGYSLVNACIEEAKEIGLKKLFALTYTPEFFQKIGFYEVDKSTLPNKIWADCIHCQYFPDCREKAMMYEIKE